MTYKAFALSTIVALASTFSGGVAIAKDLDESVLSIYGEVTIGGLTARVTQGINPDNTAGTLGAFSEFHGDGTTTIDFNAAPTQTIGNSFTFGNDAITYTFTNPLGQGAKIFNDRWAPSGANGEVNESDYLAIFKGSPVTIDLAKNVNYFGFDWGALSPGNDVSFWKEGLAVSSFTYDDINPIAPVKATHQNNEGNGYLHFYTEDNKSAFDQIIITQSVGGGFETDNHTFNFDDDAFSLSLDDSEQDSENIPEPATILGLVTMGALMLRRKIIHA